MLGVALGLDLVDADEEDLLGEADDCGFGLGEAVFSVVTDTEGSDLVVVGVVTSGGGAGDALSSCVNASPAVANRAARQRTVIFIGSPKVDLAVRSPGCAGRYEGRILVSPAILRQGRIALQNPLAVIVL